MKADAKKPSTEYKRDGITVLIRPTAKNGVERFVLDYRLKGQRKLVWRSTLADAKQAASDAIAKIVAGQSEVLSLTNADAHVYLRSREIADAARTPLDVLAREAADARALLAGRASVLEACRDWLKRNNVAVPLKTVSQACDDCLASLRKDNKSKTRISHLSAVFDAFKRDNNTMVSEVTPAIVKPWLSGLKWGERTRRNYRDAIGYLNRWCVASGYLTKGTDWLEGVQNYSADITSEIQVFTPDELTLLLTKADKSIVPFIAIQAFSGVRHAEVARLDWSEIKLSDIAGESFIEVKKSKSKVKKRRLVPVQENLKAWLLKHRKDSGPICEYSNTTKQLLKASAETGVDWKRNALRKSFISYRLASIADIARVAREAGTSAEKIESNYDKTVLPAEAVKWFAITPKEAA